MIACTEDTEGLISLKRMVSFSLDLDIHHKTGHRQLDIRFEITSESPQLLFSDISNQGVVAGITGMRKATTVILFGE